jgi:hypothetical protein
MRGIKNHLEEETAVEKRKKRIDEIFNKPTQLAAREKERTFANWKHRKNYFFSL